MLKITSHNFSVVRKATRNSEGKMSGNVVAIEGNFVTVWPRDKQAFLADIEQGEIPVRVSARIYTPEGGEPRAQVNMTYVGGSAGDLVGEDESPAESLAGEDPAPAPAKAPAAATK